MQNYNTSPSDPQVTPNTEQHSPPRAREMPQAVDTTIGQTKQRVENPGPTTGEAGGVASPSKSSLTTLDPFDCDISDNESLKAIKYMREAAKRYASIGWHVFPLHVPLFDENGDCMGCTCEHGKRTGYDGESKPKPDYVCPKPGKHPIISNWEEKATTEEGQINKWWGQLWSLFKDRDGKPVKVIPNIGIATGPSGLIVLDRDDYKDNYKGDDLQLTEETVTDISGSLKGSHEYFKGKASDKLGNHNSTLPDGLDVRGWGGLVVVAPSLHESGNRYQWELDYSPFEMDPAPIPEKLRTLLLEAKKNSAKAANVSFSDDPIPDIDIDDIDVPALAHSLIVDGHTPGADRSDQDWHVACELVKAGLTDDEIRGVFSKYPVGEKYLESGDHYLARTIGNARTKEGQNKNKSTSRDAVIALIAPHDGDKNAMRLWAIDNVELLAKLPEADREAVYVRIGNTAGVGWIEKPLRKLVTEELGEANEKKTVAQKLNELVDEKCTFYLNQFEDLMTIVDGEHVRARSNKFNGWVRKEYFLKYGAYPGNDVVSHLKGHMLVEYQHDRRESYIRVANTENSVTIDIGQSRYIEANDSGWEITDGTDISFISTAKMQSLVSPSTSGNRELLRKYINVTDEQWPIVQAWIAYALYGRGPFPILVLTGSAGSAKTSTSRRIRDIIDPQVIKDMSLPYGIKPKSIMLSAKNGYVLAYDNISSMSREISDTLCRIATGAGDSDRQLYTDDEEMITVVTRPIILTGITEFVAGKEDLLSRSILTNLPRLENRTTEEELDAGFKKDLPSILGGFLDLLTIGVHRLPETTVDNPPRMADFAKFVKAIAPFIGLNPDTVISEMLQEENDQQSSIVYDSPTGCAIVKMMENRSEKWEGTATEMLTALKVNGDLLMEDAPTARKIGDTVRRLANGLSALGIAHKEIRKNGAKLHVFEKLS